MKKLHGISIFEGIRIGKPYVKKQEKREVEIRRLAFEMVDEEIRRFEIALEDTRKEIAYLLDSLSGKVQKKDIKILNVHLMLLEDPVFLSDITNKIKLEMLNAEKVVESVMNKYIGMFKALGDKVYSQRAIDIQDVSEKIILNLQGVINIKEKLDGKILIDKELKPSEILMYHSEGINIRGIVTEEGGETSHVAILAKSFGIPTMMGVEKLLINNFDVEKDIILDSRNEQEMLILEPIETILTWYEKEMVEFEREEVELKALRDKPAFTKNGNRINLLVNIGGLEEMDNVLDYSPDGVGLLRTEFIYMESDDFPTEEEQFSIYRGIVEKIGKEKPVTIRTLDIGADKKLSYLKMNQEENPFLGLRAVRFTLKHKEILKTQIRAILRASSFGNVKIMYPMITSYEELEKLDMLYQKVKKDLKKEGVDFDENTEVGIMIETPSAAVLSDIFAKYVDFFSIGTNDLTQYVLAADRLSKEVAYLYDNYHPAVLRLIDLVAKNAIKEGKEISVCGEMGGDKRGIVALLSFGIKNLSMLPSLTSKIKSVINVIDDSSLEKIRNEILEAKKSDDVKNLLNDFLIGVM